MPDDPNYTGPSKLRQGIDPPVSLAALPGLPAYALLILPKIVRGCISGGAGQTGLFKLVKTLPASFVRGA